MRMIQEKRKMGTRKLARYVRHSAQLAAVLEVSGWPKPGNVHRLKDHPDARYEHFLAGAVALGSAVEDAAVKGAMVGRRKEHISRIGVGNLIKKAVAEISLSHRGGNTHLGICLLFIPLGAAAAKTYVENGDFLLDSLRADVMEIVKSTTRRDVVAVYEAVRKASSPGSMGKLKDNRVPDLYDEEAKTKIVGRGLTLFDVMNDASSYDTVASELVTGMNITFNIGYKELTETFNKTGDINKATVHTFLRILSEVPDTFIARKVGLKKTNDVKKAVKIGKKETSWICEAAKEVLNLGGLSTAAGRTALRRLDSKLQSLGKDYNPGTTADLTAAALMIALLNGLRF